MKKLLIMAAAVGMVFTSCTNDEEDLSLKEAQKQQITFAAPVMYGQTRVVLGEIANPYPTDETFTVFGKRYKSYTNWTSGTEIDDEFDNTDGEVATYKDLSASGFGKSWYTANVHYFEKDFKYTFGAYSPSNIKIEAGTGSKASAIAYGATGLTVTNYEPGKLGEQVDLMYSDRVYDITSASTLASSGNGNDNYDGVNLLFHHALTSIHFKVGFTKAFEDKMKAIGGKYATALNDFKLYNITVKNIINKGTFKQNLTDGTGNGTTSAPAWEPDAPSVSDLEFFNSIEGVSIPQGKDGKGQDISELTTGYVGLLIPQDFVDSGSNTDVEIIWSHKDTNGAGAEKKFKTTINLKPLTGGATRWDVAKRYTYTILIDKDIIYFAPSVADWDAEVGNEKNLYDDLMNGGGSTVTFP